jgi:hypothetical protein
MIKDLASSRVFRITVRGAPFLLKINTRANDPARHYACMKAAAEAGVASSKILLKLSRFRYRRR